MTQRIKSLAQWAAAVLIFTAASALLVYQVQAADSPGNGKNGVSNQSTDKNAKSDTADKGNQDKGDSDKGDKDDDKVEPPDHHHERSPHKPPHDGDDDDQGDKGDKDKGDKK